MKYYVLGLAVLMSGCTASSRYGYGLSKGTQDGLRFSKGEEVKEGYAVGYVKGFKMGVSPEFAAAEQARKDAELAEQESAKQAKAAKEAADKEATRNTIKDALGCK